MFYAIVKNFHLYRLWWGEGNQAEPGGEPMTIHSLLPGLPMNSQRGNQHDPSVFISAVQYSCKSPIISCYFTTINCHAQFWADGGLVCKSSTDDTTFIKFKMLLFKNLFKLTRKNISRIYT